MKSYEKRLELSLRCSILGQMYLNNLEELKRVAKVDKSEEILLNRTIYALRVKEKHFDELDEIIPEDIFDRLLIEVEDFVEVAGKLRLDKLKEATKKLKEI